jgi:hypothetical protein
MVGRQDHFELLVRLVITDALRAALKPEIVRGSNLGRHVLIRLGSQVMIPGKIMQRMRPNIMSKTNGIDDL